MSEQLHQTAPEERPGVERPAPGGDGSGEIVSARRASQGIKLGRMRYVLLCSLTLVIVAFVIGYLAF